MKSVVSGMDSEPYVMRTSRLTLRACTVADAAVLSQLYADPEVARFIGGDRLTAGAAAEQAEKFASVWSGYGYGQSILLDRADGRPIGRVGLHPWAEWGELELGWVLARRSQGKGLAAEAARAWLDWARRAHVAPYLTAVIHPDNSASLQLAARLGFVFDRTDQTPWSPAVIYRYDVQRRA